VAVDADQVDAIAASVADIYREAEGALVRLVRRHLDAGLDSPAAEQRLGTIRALRRGAQTVIAALEADSGPGIRNALAASYRHGWSNATAGLPERFFPESGVGTNARLAARERSGTSFVEALAQALHRDFGNVTRNILRNVEDAYQSVQAAAAARILTGAETRRQAAQAAWQRLVDRGIMGFTDRAGRRWRLSSYVEMATRTNAQRAATTGQVDRLDAVGVNLVVVSDSPQECKLCRPFEGKILRTDDGPLDVEVEHPTRDGVTVTVEAYATLDQARAKGLFHPNCRHSVSAYLPGVSRPPAQPTADPDGDRARQRQRELERRIRRQKERAEAALTPEARKAANARVRKAQADLRQHLADNPKLKRLRYREQPGAGNIPPRGGAPGGPTGDITPPRQPTLDSGPAARPPSRTRRVDDRDQPPARDREPAPNQPELERPPTLEPRQLRDADLERRAMDALNDPSRTDEFERLAAEIDRRDAARRAADRRNVDPATLTDDDLQQALQHEFSRPDPDEAAIARLSAEVDRREAAARQATRAPGQVPPADELRRMSDADLERLAQKLTREQDIDDLLDDLLDLEGTGREGPDAPIRRELERREKVRQKAPNPADLSDDDLDAALRAALDGPDSDPLTAERLAAEVERRRPAREAREARERERRERREQRAQERREREAEAKADRMAELLDAGVPEEEAVEEVYGISIATQRRRRAIDALRGQGYSGKGFEELARKSYQDYVHRQYLAASEATRGVLTTAQGQARGIDHLRLFTSNEAFARKWASDELKAWWDTHGRMTFAEWKAQLLDDQGAARRQRERQGGDFLK